MYTYESLEALTKENLMVIVDYNKIQDVSMRMRKGDIIEAILDYMKPERVEVKRYEVSEEGLPPMSARVRRIYESQEK